MYLSLEKEIQIDSIAPSGLAVSYCDSGRMGCSVCETLHDCTLNDSLPCFGWLHDLSLLLDSVAEAFFEVVGRAKSPDKEDCTDGGLGCGNLLLDKLDYLLNDRFKDDTNVRGFQRVATTVYSQRLVIGKATHGNGVGFFVRSIRCEVPFDLQNASVLSTRVDAY